MPWPKKNPRKSVVNQPYKFESDSEESHMVMSILLFYDRKTHTL